MSGRVVDCGCGCGVRLPIQETPSTYHCDSGCCLSFAHLYLHLLWKRSDSQFALLSFCCSMHLQGGHQCWYWKFIYSKLLNRWSCMGFICYCGGLSCGLHFSLSYLLHCAHSRWGWLTVSMRLVTCDLRCSFAPFRFDVVKDSDY